MASLQFLTDFFQITKLPDYYSPQDFTQCVLRHLTAFYLCYKAVPFLPEKDS